MTCKTCTKEKDNSNFYSTNKSTCKDCLKDRKKAWEKANPDKARIHKRTQKAKQWRNPDVRKRRQEYYRQWYRENGRSMSEAGLISIKKWAKNNPEKTSAHQRVRYAVKTGKIIKPTTCSLCCEDRRVMAHHRDYSKPLAVDWLCHSCHKRVHSGAISLPGF